MIKSKILHQAAVMASMVLAIGFGATAYGQQQAEGTAPVGLKLNAHPEPARVHGWGWKLPPDQVKPKSSQRNNVFYVGQPVTFKLGGDAASYEVRDYWGKLVDQGPAGASVTLHETQPGWYKLYVYGKKTTKQWGDIVGGTTFMIFRDDPHFPKLSPDVPIGPQESDPASHGLVGFGPERWSVQDAAKPDKAIAELDKCIALSKKYYLPFDPARHRALMIAFPNGTKGKLDGVKKIVAHFKGVVQYWEPRNEPNGGSNGTDFAVKEMKPFYDAVKSVDPDAKVMGPGTVGIGPPGHMLKWIEDFLKAGGGKDIDVFSFHIYNGINGDLSMGRKSLDALNALLTKYGVAKKEKWQTEQGYMAAVYGDYQPHLQARWSMLMYMLFEQYGIPKEHDYYFYDLSHGFWDFPTWYENDGGGLNPIADLMRVWSEELYGTHFSKAYDFGDPGNSLYIASLFTSPAKNVAAFQSAGSTKGQVTLDVTGGQSLHLISAFGVASDLPVDAGKVMLPVGLLPVYVELAKGQTIAVEPTNWGPNLAHQTGVTAEASPPAKTAKPVKKDDISKLTNDVLENWYYAQGHSPRPWELTPASWPATVEVDLPKAASVDRVVVYACVPWQGQGTLLNYEVQYNDGGKWVTVDHIAEPTRTFGVFTPPTRTTVDSFSSDRCIFQSHFKPVTAQKIRLLIHDASWGGGASKIIGEAGGQSGSHSITLREIKVYGQ